MAVMRAFGISVSSLDEALAVPKAVRDAWQTYTFTVIQHYDLVAEGGLRWKLKETHDH